MQHYQMGIHYSLECSKSETRVSASVNQNLGNSTRNSDEINVSLIYNRRQIFSEEYLIQFFFSNDYVYYNILTLIPMFDWDLCF